MEDGEKRTHYYLSKLAYLRWQRHVGELRNYKDAVDKYNRDVNKYKKDKNSYDGEVAKYNLKEGCLGASRSRRKNQADTAVLDSEWDRLQGLYSALSMEKHRLPNQKESLNMKFEGVKGALTRPSTPRGPVAFPPPGRNRPRPHR